VLSAVIFIVFTLIYPYTLAHTCTQNCAPLHYLIITFQFVSHLLINFCQVATYAVIMDVGLLIFVTCLTLKHSVHFLISFIFKIDKFWKLNNTFSGT